MNTTPALCGLCHSPYDQTDQSPRILVSCGDTLCTACIRRLLGEQSFLECPFDKTRCFVSQRGIETFPVNSALLRLIEATPRTSTGEIKHAVKEKRELCGEHGEEMRLFCMEDKCAVCEECLEHDHKGHYVKSIKKMKTEANKEVKRLEDVVAAMEKYNSEVNVEVENVKSEAVKEVKRRFGEVVTVLEKRENDVIKGIERIFESEKRRMKTGNKNNEEMKKQIRERMEELETAIKLQDLSKMEEEDKKDKIEYNANDGVLGQKVQEQLRNTLKGISESVNKCFEEESSLVSLMRFTGTEQMTTIPEKKDLIITKRNDIGNKVDKTIKLNKQKEEERNIFERISRAEEPKSNSSERFRAKKENINLNEVRKAKKTSRNESPEEPRITLQRAQSEKEPMRNLQVNEEVKSRKEDTMQDTLSKSEQLFRIEKESDDLIILLLSSDTQQKVDATKNTIELNKIKTENSVVLQLGKSPVPREAVGELKTIWENLGDITSLKVNYSTESASDTQISTLLPVIFSKRDKLSRIEVNLEYCPIGDQSLSMLCKDFLYRLRNLTALKLNFKATDITDKGIEVFAKDTLAYLARNLQELELDLSRTNVTNLSVSKIFIEMPRLKKLTFRAIETSVGDVIIAALANKTLHSAQNLESLELYLSKTRVTDHGLGFLTWNTEKMKKFRLDMGHTSITEKGMSSVSKSIARSKQVLEDLGLWLINTKAADPVMWTSLIKMAALKKLSLDFRETVTKDDLICTLAKRMGDMVALEDLELYLGATKVTDQGMSRLFRVIKELRRLHLDLNGTQVSNTSMELFKKSKVMREDYEYFEVDLERTKVNDGLKSEIEMMRKKSVE